MKDQIVPYETARMLKELGFDEMCIATYRHDKGHEPTPIRIKPDGEKNSYWENTHECKIYTAPLWQQVKQWLWDKYKVSMEVTNYVESEQGYKFKIWNTKEWLSGFSSPITAENEGIKKAVEHLYKTRK